MNARAALGLGLLLLAAALVPAVAQTQTVWRCGPDGRDYRDSPCPDGQALALAVTPAATDAPSRAPAAVLARDRALAERLRTERQALEREQAARQPGAGLASLGAGRKPADAVKPPAKRAGEKKPPASKPAKPAKPRPSAAPAPRRAPPAAAGTSPSADRASRPAPG